MHAGRVCDQLQGIAAEYHGLCAEKQLPDILPENASKGRRPDGAQTWTHCRILELHLRFPFVCEDFDALHWGELLEGLLQQSFLRV